MSVLEQRALAVICGLRDELEEARGELDEFRSGRRAVYTAKAAAIGYVGGVPVQVGDTEPEELAALRRRVRAVRRALGAHDNPRGLEVGLDCRACLAKIRDAVDPSLYPPDDPDDSSRPSTPA